MPTKPAIFPFMASFSLFTNLGEEHKLKENIISAFKYNLFLLELNSSIKLLCSAELKGDLEMFEIIFHKVRVENNIRYKFSPVFAIELQLGFPKWLQKRNLM